MSTTVTGQALRNAFEIVIVVAALGSFELQQLNVASGHLHVQNNWLKNYKNSIQDNFWCLSGFRFNKEHVPRDFSHFELKYLIEFLCIFIELYKRV